MNRSTDFQRNRVLAMWFVIGLLPLSFVGCDLGVYGSRYRERLPELTQRSESSKLLMPGYTELAGVGGSLRLPVVFDGAVMLEASQLASAPNRVQPPGIEIPGMRFALEQLIQDPTGMRYPIYVYVAKVDGESDLEVVKKAIEDKVAAKIQDKANWKKVNLESLNGQATSWEMASFGSAQPFQALPPNAQAPDGFDLQSLEGKLFYYIRATEGGVNILAWRYPSQIADQIGFPAAVDASMGTLR